GLRVLAGLVMARRRHFGNWASAGCAARKGRIGAAKAQVRRAAARRFDGRCATPLRCSASRQRAATRRTHAIAFAVSVIEQMRLGDQDGYRVL
ncbi:MAG: hypothetical protein ACKVQR_09575, partial [Aquabacterium sp.]